jgi:UDP-N-acetylglucosamine 1-carboxyvinyltransferase
MLFSWGTSPLKLMASMDCIRIRGGRPLSGEIMVGGAKNAALPIMAASLLTNEQLTLANVPQLSDIRTMKTLLTEHGVSIEASSGNERILSFVGSISNTTAPYDIVRKMRASVLVLGPLLARVGEARVSLPGGCAIGARPIDLHIKGLKQLGAQIILENGYINAYSCRRLQGAEIILPFASVGATENILMAASLADGCTTIVNAAREPEIADLINCLISMGARITGVGSNKLTIEGVKNLHGATHKILSDRIEAGSYACAAAISGGSLLLRNADARHMAATIQILHKAGVDVSNEFGGLRVNRLGKLCRTDAMTKPYPGFATDMQAQFTALMSVADGVSTITETIFENRFMHVPELNRMGARINLHGGSAIIQGVPSLSGAPVMATDLRASVSLVLAGLVARGETTVSRIYHLDRGYEMVEQKLAACGADIERLT